VAWELCAWNGKGGDENRTFKAANDQRSFLFRLKNPHNVGARRFALKAGMKHGAICCSSDWGPVFGGGNSDIAISGRHHRNMESSSGIGNSCTNDTGLDANTFFTGSWNFKVKEIEVFERTD
jgi:hypothetical protein